MSLEMVLNELSLQELAGTVQVARQRMQDLIGVLQAASTHGMKVLRTHDDLNYMYLAHEYPVVRWRNDEEVDREARRFFRRLQTSFPLLTDIDGNKLLDKHIRSQFFHHEQEAQGLGVAFLLNALAISLRSHACWGKSHLELTLVELDDDSDLSDETPITVVHASSREHVHSHVEWIKERIRRETQLSIYDGVELWQRREELFPDLQFCPTVEGQLLGVLHGHVLLQSLMKRLHDLESYCINWQGGPFALQEMGCKTTTESAATLEQYSQEHTFCCPDGLERLFSWHVRLTPVAWRIYFFPDEHRRQLIIGYIGPHLPTVRYH